MKRLILFLITLPIIFSSCNKDENEINEINEPINYPSFGIGEELKARSKYGDYILATFSFEYATRDNQDLVHNDWDIQYGNGTGDRIHVNMVTDDQSTIADLGVVNFDDVINIPLSANYEEDVVADTNHVYVVHTVDSETDMYAKFIITDMKSDDWIKFNWVRSDNGTNFNY